MLERARRFIEQNWWGILPAYFIILLGTYLALWQLTEPLGLPENITELPVFMRSRIFIHLVLTPLIAAHVTLLLFLIIRLRTRKYQPAKLVGENNPFVIRTYLRSQDPRFFLEVERLIPLTKKITLISSGLNLIWNKHILDALIERARSGAAEVIICVGNPYSPHIQSRWIEEMQYIRPQFGREAMAENLEMLLQQISEAGAPISVLLFEHYLTFATLIFDDNIFVYPYAYELLGNFSPIFHLRNNGSPEAKFFLDNARRILSKSVPARDVINAHLNRRYWSNKWISLAVFVIPDLNSTFYDFGCRILGYDVRGQKLIPPSTQEIDSLRKYVGEAQEFGFHATLADHLFFASEKSIDRIKAEIKALSEDFKPFTLSDFRVAESFRERDTLVILCNDESGATEALHFELVSRMYRCAVSSIYLTGRAQNKLPAKHTARMELMIRRYGAPYILKEFDLYFTLCSRLPNEKRARSEAIQAANNLFKSMVKESELQIADICLVVKRPEDSYWRILEVFPLIGR